MDLHTGDGGGRGVELMFLLQNDAVLVAVYLFTFPHFIQHVLLEHYQVLEPDLGIGPDPVELTV